MVLRLHLSISMKTLKKASLSLILAFTTTVNAETYRAFTYQDQSISERPDIHAIYNANGLNVSADKLSQVEQVRFKDVNLFFFKEVAQWLNTANNPSNEVWKPLETPNLCSQHQAFDLKQIPEAKNLCLSARLLLKKTFAAQTFTRNCQEAYAPEIFANDIAEGELQASKMDQLPVLIQTVIKPLSHVPVAENLAPAGLLQKMRLLLTKIRMEELLKNVQEQKKHYNEVFHLLDSTNCFSTSDQELLLLKGKLQILSLELEQAESYLVQLDQQGRHEASADQARLEASGRKRAELPYPNLSDADREFITMYLSGVYWRLRGGGLLAAPNGTQKTRVFYTWLPMKALARLNGGHEVDSVGFYTFLRLLKGYAQFWDMGYDPGNDQFWDLNKMTERGAFQTKSSAKFLDHLGYNTEALRMGGLQMGACYYYPQFTDMKRLKYAGHTKSAGPVPGSPYVAFLTGHTEWGEVCYGMALGLGLSRTLLNGKETSVAR